MDILIYASLIWLVLAALAYILFKNRPERIQAKKELITPHEQKMYCRLVSALPNHVVLAQVSFNALVTAQSPALRSTFNRKVADFVILNKDFELLAVIELDDRSHLGREEIDAQRDFILTQAHIPVLRYTKIPSAQTLKKDLAR